MMTVLISWLLSLTKVLPAAIATQASWGRQFEGRQYFETVLVKTLDEIFGEQEPLLIHQILRGVL